MKERFKVVGLTAIILVSIVILGNINSKPMKAEFSDIDKIYLTKTCTTCANLEYDLGKIGIEYEKVYLEDEPNINISSVPTAITGSGKVLLGDKAIRSYIEHGKVSNAQRDISLKGVVAASLIDSVNPCALASLAFILAYNKGKRKLFNGAIFVGTVFVIYTLIGYGIIALNLKFTGVAGLSLVISRLALALCIVGLYKTVKDLMHKEYTCEGGICRLDDLEDESLTVRITRSMVSSDKSVLLVATAVAISEFACTGQVYIPTLTLASSRSEVYFYLIMYNIIFVSPMILLLFVSDRMESTLEKIKSKKMILSGLNIMLFSALIYFIIS